MHGSRFFFSRGGCEIRGTLKFSSFQGVGSEAYFCLCYYVNLRNFKFTGGNTPPPSRSAHKRYCPSLHYKPLKYMFTNVFFYTVIGSIMFLETSQRLYNLCLFIAIFYCARVSHLFPKIMRFIVKFMR